MAQLQLVASKRQAVHFATEAAPKWIRHVAKYLMCVAHSSYLHMTPASISGEALGLSLDVTRLSISSQYFNVPRHTLNSTIVHRTLFDNQ